jgi:acetolactate synthase-1/2/3 large subunit
LRARGVKTVFALCGDHTNPILESCDEAGIRIVDTRDERGAAWMAAGWALATGEPGVVVVSNTPALTNAATALADSNASGTPVLCITGGVAMIDRGTGHPGDADQVAIARPISRWAARAETADSAGSRTLDAFDAARQSESARAGVAVLELPMDAQHGRTRTEVVDRSGEKPRPSRTVNDIAALLSKAERPVIVAGSGVYWAGAGEPLRELAERARIPVFTVRAARGLIPDDHELGMGFLNLLTPAAQLAFGEADVALILGCELDILVGGGNFHPGCTVIRVDVDQGSFSMGRKAEIEIQASPLDVLIQTAQGAEALPTDPWVKSLRAAVDARAAEVAKRAQIASSPLHPGRLVAEIAAALPRDAIVTVDAGELALWAIDGIHAFSAASFHASSGSALGALGMGLPWAIGMKLAHPERAVLTVVGDGSFGFTALELETSKRHNAPVAAVVGNDGGWGIVRHLQQAIHGRALASDLPVAPYELLAEFAGGTGDRVETPQQLSIAVTNALVADRPSVVNAIIDPAVQHEAMPLIAAMFQAKLNG